MHNKYGKNTLWSVNSLAVNLICSTLDPKVPLNQKSKFQEGISRGGSLVSGPTNKQKHQLPWLVGPWWSQHRSLITALCSVQPRTGRPSYSMPLEDSSDQFRPVPSTQSCWQLNYKYTGKQTLMWSEGWRPECGLFESSHISFSMDNTCTWPY